MLTQNIHYLSKCLPGTLPNHSLPIYGRIFKDLHDLFSQGIYSYLGTLSSLLHPVQGLSFANFRSKKLHPQNHTVQNLGKDMQDFFR